MMGIKGVVMPKKMNIHDGETELTAELHMSFFYRDMENSQAFFFGRTARSAKTTLTRDKGGNSYSSIEKDERTGKPQYQSMYFHSKLGPTLQEASRRAERGGGKTEVMLVFELVVTATDTAKRGESQVFSGGYGTLEHKRIFGIGKG